MTALKMVVGGKELIHNLSTCLTLTENDYADRYSAD